MEAANGIKSAVATEETRSVHKPKPRGGYTCCVPGCYSNSKKDTTLSFHKIPKDEPYRTKWINAIKRKEVTPGEHHHVCSVYFRNARERKWVRLMFQCYFLYYPDLLLENLPQHDKLQPKSIKQAPSQ